MCFRFAQRQSLEAPFELVGGLVSVGGESRSRGWRVDRIGKMRIERVTCAADIEIERAGVDASVGRRRVGRAREKKEAKAREAAGKGGDGEGDAGVGDEVGEGGEVKEGRGGALQRDADKKGNRKKENIN